MNAKFLLGLNIALLILSTGVYASKAPIKYGKVSMQELEMSSYSLDSTAPAVVLCDYGVWNLSDYKFRKTIRIKILTKEGLEYANQIYPSDEGTSIRGMTFNLVNGEIQVDKLKNESIFKERIYEDYYNYRIAMPNVKVGSVIDIEITHFGIPSVWYFQKEIPIKWSELIIPESMYIDYRKHYFGLLSLELNSRNHWIAKNMPSFKSEPFINSPENFITKFEFDVLAYHFPGYYKEFTTDWNAVARRLEESSYFGSVLNAALYLSSVTKLIESKDSTQFGRMKLAFEEAKTVKWNEEESFLSTHVNLNMSYKDKIGNSADVNLILVNLLRKLDISAHPVVLSTRSNGLLPLFSPSFNKLNYVIVWAKIDNIEYLLDATDENTPIGILPVRCLNGSGHIMKDEKSVPISLSTNKKDFRTEVYYLKIGDDFTITGSVTTKKTDYGAYNFREYFKNFNSTEDVIEDIMKKNQGLIIKDYEVENLDNIDEPVMEKYQIELSNQIYSIENKYYLTPLLHLKTTDNPFKLEDRKYPVDFAYASENKYIFQIDVPEGLIVSEVPSPLKMLLPDDAGSILYQVKSLGNKISIVYNYNINKPNFSQEEYQYLREFYSQIIAKQSEPIIFTKKQ